MNFKATKSTYVHILVIVIICILFLGLVVFNTHTFTDTQLLTSSALDSLADRACSLGSDKDSVIDVKTVGAKGDGVTNDSVFLQAAVAQAVARSGQGLCSTIYFPPGTYILNHLLGVLPSNTTVIGEGATSILKRYSCPEALADSTAHCNYFYPFRTADYNYTNGFFALDDSHHVAIRNLTFDFNYASGNFNGINFRQHGSSDIHFVSNRFTDSNSHHDITDDKHAIMMSATISPSSDIYIANNTADGEMQITGGGGKGITHLEITDNTVINGYSYPIAITTIADGGYFFNILIARNTITGGGYGIMLGPDSSNGTNSHFEHIQILNNTIKDIDPRSNKDNPAYGMFITASENNTSDVLIEGNTLTMSRKSPYVGIRFNSTRFPNDFQACTDKVTYRCPQVHWVENVTVRNNTIDGFAWGIVAEEIRDATIENNPIRNNIRGGIQVFNTFNTTIKNNTIDANRLGINVLGNKNLRILSNTITNSHLFADSSVGDPNVPGIYVKLPYGTTDGALNSVAMRVAQVAVQSNTITDTRPVGSKTQEYAIKQIFDSSWLRGTDGFLKDTKGNVLANENGFDYDVAVDKTNTVAGNKLSDLSVLAGIVKTIVPRIIDIPNIDISHPNPGGNPSSDKTPPSITLKGSSTYILTVGTAWTDEGATAKDTVDGDLTDQIKTTGSVDVNTPGDYKITYTVTDKAGNITNVTRTIIVYAPQNSNSSGGGGVISSPAEVVVTTNQSPTQPISKTIEFHVEQKPQVVATPTPKPSVSVKPKPQTTPAKEQVPTVVPPPPVQTLAISSIDYTLNDKLIHTTSVFPDTWTFDTTTLPNDAYVLKTVYHYADNSTDTSLTIFTVKNGHTLIQSIGDWIHSLWDTVVGWF
jgi:polygalacturonase